MAWPPDFRSATKATCPRSLTAWPTPSAEYGLSGPVSAMGVTVYESTIRSSSASTVSWQDAGCRRGEERRARAELGRRAFRIEENHMNHDLLPKTVCQWTATTPARRPCAGACG